MLAVAKGRPAPGEIGLLAHDLLTEVIYEERSEIYIRTLVYHSTVFALST